MGVEGLTLQPEEAERFLTAAQNVARHYSVETTQRTLDWIAFAGVSVQVFGTRAIAVVVSKSKAGRGAAPARAPRGPVAPDPVVNVDGTPYSPSVPPGPDGDAFN
ncbi:MAG: hypothetical protein IPK79_01345 [Vampirovibrionales bacterium]|nr:hypothetical protein [Vampirovibrionales bacterium]